MLVRNKQIVVNYACFCVATTLTSKIITEPIENHCELCGCANSCNKCFQSIFINHKITYDSVPKKHTPF